MTRCLLAVLVLLGAWSPAQARHAPTQKPTLDSRIDVRLEAMPAVEAFRHIISGLGYELQMDASVDAPVTLWVTHVSARTALNVVCESLGCTWRIDGTRLVVGGQSGRAVAKSDSKVAWVGVLKKSDADTAKFKAMDLRASLKKPLPVDMQFQDVPVSTILRAMSEVSGLEITAKEPLASKHVTLTGSGKTVEDAIKAVIEQVGGGAAAVFMVMARNDPAAPSITIAIKTQVSKIKKQQ